MPAPSCRYKPRLPKLPPQKLAAPAFCSTTPCSVSLALPLASPRSSAAPVAMSNDPPPETVPPTQVTEPSTVSSPAVLNVAPLSVRPPAMDDVVLSASEPFEMSRADWLDEIVKLLTASDTDVSCVTVMFGRLMTTSSDGPGSAPVLQFDGVSQSPPFGLIQVTVASSVRSSSRFTAGRKP